MSRCTWCLRDLPEHGPGCLAFSARTTVDRVPVATDCPETRVRNGLLALRPDDEEPGELAAGYREAIDDVWCILGEVYDGARRPASIRGRYESSTPDSTTGGA